jgi:hypothetical protein
VTQYGPIITAIDNDHVECTNGDLAGKCRTCHTKWPCSVMKQAKKDQVAYAEKVAREDRHRKALSMSRR